MKYENYLIFLVKSEIQFFRINCHGHKSKKPRTSIIPVTLEYNNTSGITYFYGPSIHSPFSEKNVSGNHQSHSEWHSLKSCHFKIIWWPINTCLRFSYRKSLQSTLEKLQSLKITKLLANTTAYRALTQKWSSDTSTNVKIPKNLRCS